MQLDWTTFTLEIVNFLALIWILQHFLYRPVLATIARRKDAIDQSLAAAAARQADAQALERQYRGRLDDWEREKAALRDAARAQLEAEREQRLAALRQALEEERERRRVLEERRAEEQRQRVAEEAAAQAARFAARLLERIASPEVEARLVAVALEDLAALPPAQRSAFAAANDGVSSARVASAYPLPEAQRGALAAQLRQAIGGRPAVEFAEDRALLAGIRVSVGAWLLQANLRDELKFFAEAARHER